MARKWRDDEDEEEFDELTRRDTPRFPVERFLAERSVSRLDREAGDDWQGRYLLHGAPDAARGDRTGGDVRALRAGGLGGGGGAAERALPAARRALATDAAHGAVGGVLILTVDRAGMVVGFPLEATAVPLGGGPQPIQTEEDSWRLMP